MTDKRERLKTVFIKNCKENNQKPWNNEKI